MGVGAVAVGEGEALLEALSVAGEEEGRALAVELTPHLGLGVEEGVAEGEGVPVLLPCPEALMLGEAVKEVEAVALGVPLRVRLETGEADTLPVAQPEGPPVRLPLLLRVPTGAVRETLEVAVRVGLAEVV